MVEELTQEEQVERFKAAHATFFWKPYVWQLRAIEVLHEKTTTAVVASNKIGKSALLCNLLVSWCLGYEPWHNVEPDSDNGIKVRRDWYRRSSLGIKPPVDLILTGEDWKLHIGRTLVPELKKWAPPWYTTKKNEQGVEYYWKWKNKSTITVMSYSQDDDLFESFRAQGVMMDEPPPQSKYSAMSRGLLLDRGKVGMFLTPLKEAWILDEIVLSGRRDIGVVDGLNITDNPDLYESDLALLGDLGLNEIQKHEFFTLLLYDDPVRKTPVSDRGLAAEKYLEKIVVSARLDEISGLKILKFIKDIDPSDVPPRVFGEFKALVGRVLKKFDDNVHLIEPFEVPTDWPVVPMIDFHLSTPQAVSYWTVNKQDIHYCIGEMWKNCNAEEIGDNIIRKAKLGWNIEDAYIDPLSKGDTAYMRNALGTDIKDTFTILDEKLSAHGITLHVASKDKTAGIKNIETRLEGPNRMPTVYIFNDCVRHIFEVKRWVYDDDGKPVKENDHMMENWYRFTLTGTRYHDHLINPLPHRQAVAGGWLGC